MLTRLLSRFSPHQPLIEVGISKDALLHNLRAYQAAYPDFGIAPVLKSNAYGHDLGLVARALDGERISFFMVDSLYEARRLRAAGVRSTVVVMGYTRPEDITSSKYKNVHFAITDIEQLRLVATRAKRLALLHIKLDTGMHRQGITPEDLSEAITLLSGNPHLSLVGVCSHFADADTEGSAHAQRQLTTWKQMLAELAHSFPDIRYKHFSATKGVRFATEAGTNVIRLGIGLYGFDTSPSHESALMPVLEMRSIVGELRTVPALDSVGYNATHTAQHASRVATVPAGYFEGVDRRLSNRGQVSVSGILCPIIGRVSMNMISVDVTHVPDAAVGDDVVLISRTLTDPHAVPAIRKAISCEHYQESEYVILAHIPQHLKRVLE
jgi:alanine racemase